MSESSEEILFTIENGVGRITLNRPEKLNAFTMSGVTRMLECLQICSNSEEVGVIVLTGAGDRAFCTGGDVGDFESFTIEVDRQMNRELMRLSHELRTCGKPVIARVNG
jgi:enoyl-CoA hydratase/carnithine racemase